MSIAINGLELCVIISFSACCELLRIAANQPVRYISKMGYMHACLPTLPSQLTKIWLQMNIRYFAIALINRPTLFNKLLETCNTDYNQC